MKIKMTLKKSGALYRVRVVLLSTSETCESTLSEFEAEDRAYAIQEARYAALQTISGLVAELQEVIPRKA